MRNKTNHFIKSILFGLILFAAAVSISAQTAEFTYRGCFNDGDRQFERARYARQTGIYAECQNHSAKSFNRSCSRHESEFIRLLPF